MDLDGKLLFRRRISPSPPPLRIDISDEHHLHPLAPTPPALGSTLEVGKYPLALLEPRCCVPTTPDTSASCINRIPNSCPNSELAYPLTGEAGRPLSSNSHKNGNNRNDHSRCHRNTTRETKRPTEIFQFLDICLYLILSSFIRHTDYSL